MSIFSNLGKRFLGFAIAEDEAANVLIGPEKNVPAAGNPHYTVSQRLAEMRERGSKVGCVGCKILSLMFKPFYLTTKNYDHCTEAMANMPESLPTDG